MCLEPSGSCGHKVTTIYSQCSTAALPSLAPSKIHFKICLLTYKALQEEQPVYLRSLIAISLPSRSLRSEKSLCPSLGSRPTLAQGPSAHVPLLFGTTFHYLSVSHLQKMSQNIPFRLGLFPVDTGVPYCLLLRNDFNDFAFEHQSGCCATEPGYAGDIGAIEIWLIDWSIDFPRSEVWDPHLWLVKPDSFCRVCLRKFHFRW